MKKNVRISISEEDFIRYLIRFMYLFLTLIFAIYLVLEISIQKKMAQVDALMAKYDETIKGERIPIEEEVMHYISTLPKPKKELNIEVADIPKIPKLLNEYQNNEGIEVKFRTTAYCPCAKCCGKTDGITASGAKATAWHTVAAGEYYPFGTKIYIPELKDEPNGGWFTVEDRGGAISNDRLDVFFESHEEAINYGVLNVTAYVYYPDED